MKRNIPYGPENAPTIGFIMTTIESEFDRSVKERVNAVYRNMFDRFKTEKWISGASCFFEYCCNEKDVNNACEKLLDARVDGIIYHPLTWPTSDTIFALAKHRYLKDIPLFVSASPEIFPNVCTFPMKWPENSNCGKIFTKSILYKLDRSNLYAVGTPDDAEYIEALQDFFTVCQLIKNINRSKTVVIGNILDDFPESFYNPLTVRREIGARVLEVDSSVVFTLFETGVYESRGLKINEKEIEEQVCQLTKGLEIKVEPEFLSKPTRAYLAYKALIESLGAEAAVFRCAPEWVEKHGIVICGVLGELIDNGVISSGGCEGDVLNTIGGLLQYYASGFPTICLDWIDKPGMQGEGIFNLLHCGNACKSMLIPGTGTADYHQAWTAKPLGYTIEGALKNGPVTITRLRENRAGKLELLIIEGESVAKEMKIRGNYALVDFGMQRLANLEQEIDENGWPHHLSLGWGHHGDILEKACRFLGDISVIRI